MSFEFTNYMRKVGCGTRSYLAAKLQRNQFEWTSGLKGLCLGAFLLTLAPSTNQSPRFEKSNSFKLVRDNGVYKVQKYDGTTKPKAIKDAGQGSSQYQKDVKGITSSNISELQTRALMNTHVSTHYSLPNSQDEGHIKELEKHVNTQDPKWQEWQ
ncbi:uncharacterized protein MELLADRAFT_104913 [Melampsora larici-populina 98AG31]|uniref:Uncharacterized protein n=1 Tax=Melampsora larici-populina (strain 98AG31 / pathotype 3-4-7) TaxID=747676 RepID=F4RGH9_MELLP|nr:uncharacterized protein MELLADRAFT_104913 [Melampsora larici-populina 98AG31]EGG08646.1 hypothetical protein MELLADRAFT_104913 [Melampsora larici-populina 98AG31]